MASDTEYRDFILEQLAGIHDIRARAMMGEYILYCRGRVFGGIYDNRLLVKPVEAALSRMPEAAREIPYPGAKELLLVDRVDDPAFLCDLIEAMYPQLPEPKVKTKSRKV